MLILETYSFRFRKGTDCYIFVFGIPAFTCLILLNIIFVKIIIYMKLIMFLNGVLDVLLVWFRDNNEEMYYFYIKIKFTYKSIKNIHHFLSLLLLVCKFQAQESISYILVSIQCSLEFEFHPQLLYS